MRRGLSHGRDTARTSRALQPSSCRVPWHFALTTTTGSPRARVLETIMLDFTACYFGGDRAWFLCPACGRRCAVLWGKGRFLCRKCQTVAYASQNEDLASRSIRRVHELRAKLNVPAAVPIDQIRRPRFMRQDRYRSLMIQLACFEAIRTQCVFPLDVSTEWAGDHWSASLGDGASETRWRKADARGLASDASVARRASPRVTKEAA
jgi:hypothetical protein